MTILSTFKIPPKFPFGSSGSVNIRHQRPATLEWRPPIVLWLRYVPETCLVQMYGTRCIMGKMFPRGALYPHFHLLLTICSAKVTLLEVKNTVVLPTLWVTWTSVLCNLISSLTWVLYYLFLVYFILHKWGLQQKLSFYPKLIKSYTTFVASSFTQQHFTLLFKSVVIFNPKIVILNSK